MTIELNRRAGLAALASLAAAPAAAAATQGEGSPLPPITIYHLEGRRSERVVWLMEELGFPYKLEFKRGDLMGSMALIKAFSPIVPMAPTVKYGDQVLVESGAIMELILNRHAPGKLQPDFASTDYPHYLMWMHFAEGSLAARLFSDYRAWMQQPPTERSRLVDSEAVVEFAEDFLKTHAWFGGAAFSAADIMMAFPLRVATELNLVETSQFPKVAAWKTRIEGRPAYQRMLAKARPDGMIGALKPLPQHAPSGPRAPGAVR
ncbi:glutathione binding-like protein [Phenylobacterium sp.]|uniref:glutathione S-transferase family protein n=1 Tax=Phenylobacterium sp. TaxID=1871053 RepID=UPI0025EDF11E|nr:glutathione binding-like protein [Phenylobacterium sp.]